MLRKLLAVLLTFAALLAIAVVLLPWLTPQDFMRRQLASALREETGIELEEARRVSLAVLPRPSIRLDGVTLRAPELGALPPITAGRFEAEIDPGAMLRDRRLVLRRILVEKPAVRFHVDAAGRGNWERAEIVSPGPRYAALAQVSPVTVEPAAQSSRPPYRTRLPTAIDLREGTISYRDERSGVIHQIIALNLAMRSDEAGGPVTLDGGFDAAGQPFSLQARLDGDQGLAPQGSPLVAELSSAAFAAGFEGAAAWGGSPSLRGGLRLDLRSAAAFGQMLGMAGERLAALDGASLRGQLDAGAEGALITGGRLMAKEAEGEFDLAADLGGKARITLARLALHGGRASGSLTLDPLPEAYQMTARLELADVDTLSLFSTLFGFDWISGRAAGSLDLAGSGRHPGAALAALAGNLRLTVTGGAIEGLALPALIAKAREGELKAWKRAPGQRTPFDNLAATFTVESGIARTSDLAMTGPDMIVTGAGQTHIPRQQLDYRLKAEVKAATEQERAGGNAETAAVAIPFLVRGNWEDPEISPDFQALVKDPKALLGTAKAFGKSVEKLTDGKIKSEDFGRVLDSLFGGKKKTEGEQKAE